ncbi:MAG: DUF4132 domain-containing protein [Ruminococcus albus]|nr:DUF4132 domain-containing protein [Ruminococcus albus]
MIFANHAEGESKLAKLLVKQGLPEENVKVFETFMDMEKPADYTLLDKMEAVSVSVIDLNVMSKFHQAAKVEIVKQKNEELTNRFLCFLWAAFRTRSVDFMDSFLTKWEADFCAELFVKALTAWKGAEQAKLCGKAVRIVCGESKTWESKIINDITDSENAADIADIVYENNAWVSMILYARLLEFSENESDVVKHIIKVLDAYYPKGASSSSRYDDKVTYHLALGEAARFDKNMLAKFNELAANHTKEIAETAVRRECYKALDMIDKSDKLCDKEYIGFLAANGRYNNADIPSHLAYIAKNRTALFTDTLKGLTDVAAVRVMAETLQKLGLPCPDINTAVSEKIEEFLRECLPQDADKVIEYLYGNIDTAEILEVLKNAQWNTCNRTDIDYYGNLGIDDFFSRYYTVLIQADVGYSKNWFIKDVTGFDLVKHEDKCFDMLFRAGLPVNTAVACVADCIEKLYSDKESTIKRAADALAEHAEELEKLETADLSAIARQMAVMAFDHDPKRYKEKIMAMVEDSSKAVKTELVSLLGRQTGWHDDIAELLTRKKSAAREMAVSVIEKQGAEMYKDALNAAFEKEKSAKIKDRIALLIGAAVSQKPEDENSGAPVDIVAELTKGGKAKKVAWCFEGAHKEVTNADGTEAPKNYLEALLMCYAAMTNFGVSPTANGLAEKLDKRSLEGFAAEVFGKWLDNGAQAKTKWVLYFAAIHGGNAMVDDFMHYIKYWGENSRGAIASEAVRAMALSGSTTALMNVDGMSRKFKNKMVRGAAAEALRNAAEELGLTTEELADKIVPDLGFDENMCREFDFGPRQFKVYLAAGNELQIFSGDKQVKNLPKPGVNDDAEKAAAASADFKEMKKQLKTVAANQKARLESVLMNDRKWSQEGWNALFVKNAVMHSFAIGLIWGLYDENGRLTETFRYTEEGSFNSIEDDEIELAPNGSIGLVHPLELTEEQISQWKEQLEDYEIVQPFVQLERKVYRMTDEERKSHAIMRFDGIELNSLSLIGKMTKAGWYKGQAEDAGFFYYFWREDVSSRTKQSDGSYLAEGVLADLEFSGASIVNYDFEGEDVTINKLELYKPGADLYRAQPVAVGEVSDRYFSELIMQLTSVLGKPEEE